MKSKFTSFNHSLLRGASVLCAALLASLLSTAALSATPPVQNTAKGILYEVKTPQNTVYLFGSIHLAKADFYPLSKEVEMAYAKSRVLAVEVDVTNVEANKQMMSLLSYVAPDNLKEHIQDETWETLKTMTGPSILQLQNFKPAVVAIGLTFASLEKYGYNSKLGIDLHFIQRAKKDKKPIIELETMAFQAGILTDLNKEEGDALLKQTLESFRKGDTLKEAEKMILAWKAGDAEALASIFEAEAEKDAGTRKMMKTLLEDRNIGMADKIQGMLKSGKTSMVVVGAGHLTGAHSVVELLQNAGLKVQRVQPIQAMKAAQVSPVVKPNTTTATTPNAVVPVKAAPVTSVTPVVKVAPLPVTAPAPAPAPKSVK